MQEERACIFILSTRVCSVVISFRPGQFDLAPLSSLAIMFDSSDLRHPRRFRDLR